MLAVFSLALFVSATLLFLVQPMFSKMVLPLLGGTPMVWNTCMAFYQGALLAGYVYAHQATRWLGVRRQAAVHVGLMLLVFLLLPIGISQGWTPPPTGNPLLWLLLLLTVSVGLPFFVVSATAPMLQKWFAHTGHRQAGDPYFLYGASNLGSLLILVAYPVLVEPRLRLAHQAWVWAAGYGVLVALIGVCGLLLFTSTSSKPAAGKEETTAPGGLAAIPGNPGAPPTLGQRAWWVLLAFAPSSLLLGVTSYLSTDIAAAPLLWVIPLAIYLLTFVLVFARKPILRHRFMVRLEPFLILPVAILFFTGVKTAAWHIFPLHLLAFFAIAMVCHGELMASRPPAAQLTEFYLWLSVGGVLGGVFNALVAPVVFNSVIEYPLIIVAACLLRPRLDRKEGRSWRRWLDLLLPALLALALLGAGWALQELEGNIKVILLVATVCLAAALVYSFRLRPTRFGLGVGAIILAGLVLAFMNQEQVLLRERNFFGVLRVTLDEDGNYHTLIHGSTVHGIQCLEPAWRRTPMSYYHRRGPLGQVFEAFAPRAANAEVAIIGLGTGTIACYGQPGQHLTFFEIDPAVARVARDPRYFTFLQDCPAKVEIVLGDARQSLQQAAAARYDMIILDAFSSDAIPIHLMTREALGLYLDRLKPGGLLVFHISSRYLDLKPVLGNLAREASLAALVRDDLQHGEEDEDEQKSLSTWLVMARTQQDLGGLLRDGRWVPVPKQKRKAVWTDDFSNILTAIDWGSGNLDKVMDFLREF